MPLGNYLMPSFKINPEQFSHIVASYSISAGCSGLIAMFFADKFDRKKVLLFAYTGFLIGTFCCGIAPTALFLMLSRIVAGLFGGILGAQVLSIVADSFDYSIRGKAMGFLFSAFSLASVIGVPLSLYLAVTWGWHTPFFFIVGMGIIVLTCIIKFLPPFTKHLTNAAPSQNILSTFKIIVFNKVNLLAFLLSGTLMLGHFVPIPFLNPFMEHNVNFNDNQRNLIYIVGGLVTIFSAPLAGKLADKYGKHKVLTAFGILSIIPIFWVTHLSPMPYYDALIIIAFWFILSSSRNIPAQALISNVVESKYRGSFQSFNSSVTSLFIGMASLIAGKVVAQDTVSKKILHYTTVGYISIGVVLLAIVIAQFIPKQAKK